MCSMFALFWSHFADLSSPASISRLPFLSHIAEHSLHVSLVVPVAFASFSFSCFSSCGVGMDLRSCTSIKSVHRNCLALMLSFALIHGSTWIGGPAIPWVSASRYVGVVGFSFSVMLDILVIALPISSIVSFAFVISSSDFWCSFVTASSVFSLIVFCISLMSADSSFDTKFATSFAVFASSSS